MLLTGVHEHYFIMTYGKEVMKAYRVFVKSTGIATLSGFVSQLYNSPTVVTLGKLINLSKRHSSTAVSQG